MAERAAVNANAAPQQSAASVALQRTCECGSHTSAGGECRECARQNAGAASRGTAHSGGGAPRTPPKPPGQPLDGDVRSFMEGAFGQDFSRVRVHADSRAADTARSLHAAAFTVGEDIVFGRGSYELGSAAGRYLLAHELAHVAQHATFGRAPARALSHSSDSAESEADNAAHRVMRGDSFRVTQRLPAVINRLSEDTKEGLLIGGSIAVAGLIGTGIAWLAGAFDAEHFSDAELREYLDGLARRRDIEGHTKGDNKARDLVRRWQAGKQGFNLNDGYRTKGGSLDRVELKRLVIKELITGWVGADDQDAVLTVLEHSNAADIKDILNPLLGVSIQRLQGEFDDDRRQRFEQLLEARFPEGGPKPAAERQGMSKGRSEHCTARQALMVDYARRSAREEMDYAINALTTRINDAATQKALKCRFPEANAQQVAQVLEKFKQARVLLMSRVYQCARDDGSFQSFLVKRLSGRTEVQDCSGGDIAFSPPEGDTRVWLCPAFFHLSPPEQTVTVVHETMHANAATDDISYDPGCGMRVSDALNNAQSFALFAHDLMTQVPPAQRESAAPEVQVTVGNFRNSGALSSDNQCEACPDLPGLGLDPSTGFNIMELRGDIANPRPDVEYDFKRTKERAIWRRTAGQWQLMDYEPPGTDDDKFDVDEDVSARKGRIFSTDTPGLKNLIMPGPGADVADDFVYRATFEEFVHARLKNGTWHPVSNVFKWHSVTWLEKVDGRWQRKTGANEIEPGSISIGKEIPHAPMGDFELLPSSGTEVV
jgi:hypothetical protein